MESGEPGARQAAMNAGTQRRLILTYKAMFVMQLCAGVGILASSSLAFLYPMRRDSVPYYSGGYTIGVMLVFASVMAFRVWHRAPQINTNAKAKQTVLCAINCHRVTSMCMMLVCLIGLCILLTFGLCMPKKTDCSYDSDTGGHRTIATISSVLGFIGIMTASIGVVLIRQFGSAFGVRDYRNRPSIPRDRRDTHAPVVVCTGNSEEQRQRDIQRQQELQLSPFSALTHTADGISNPAFQLPQLPRYSPSAVSETNLQDNAPVGGEATRDILLQLSPLDLYNYSEGVIQDRSTAPPSYSEAVQSNLTTTSTGSRNAASISKPPPPYAFNKTIEKYMVSQID